MSPGSSRRQILDAPVSIGALLARREIHVVLIIVALLIVIPFWIHGSQRAERIGRAILNGRDAAVEKIITDHPKLLNSRDSRNGFTPLHWAVIAGRSNLVCWLINKGADVNAADPSGMTPLHKAAVFNRAGSAEALIAAGADYDVCGRKYGALQLMPIHLAAEEGKLEVIKCLLDRGVDVNAATRGANCITPLHFAAAKGRTNVIEYLISAGADINACDLARKTPLAWAVESGQIETAQMLRKAGAVP